MLLKRMIPSLSLILISLSSNAQAQEVRSGYAVSPARLCDGFPQISVTTAPGSCVGIMASKDNGLKMPRYAAQGSDGTIYISDMGGWSFGQGTIWAYRLNRSTARLEWVNLFPNKKLTMPNGLLMDPEGRLYVGTPTGIVRFRPQDSNGIFRLDSELEMVVDQFAQSIFRKDEYKGSKEYNALDSKFKNKHPLIQMTVNKDFTQMYFNVGAPSNDCSRGLKTVDEKGACIQSESPLASAAVWKVDFQNNTERKVLKSAVFSRGLRNSMALAIHPQTGAVFQGENGIDLTDPEKPYEEINVLEEGKHYGWPYCHSAGEVSPFFTDKVSAETCLNKYTRPAMFLPAHSAPLGMLFYTGQKIKSLNNKLVVSLHGYAKYGHRLVGIEASSQGIAGDNKIVDIVSGWEASPGVRPLGAPTGILQLLDGSILILDDKNSAVLRLSSGESVVASPSQPKSDLPGFTEVQIKAFAPMVASMVKNCAMCHTQFAEGDAAKVLSALQTTGMIQRKNPSESPIYLKLKKKEMPPDFIRAQLKFTDQEGQELQSLIEVFIRTL